MNHLRMPAVPHRLPHTTSSASLSSQAAAALSGPSPAQQARFAALQQHIDELTSEKLELARGLAKQVCSLGATFISKLTSFASSF